MDFIDFQGSKKILILDQSLSHFETEEGDILPTESQQFLTLNGQDIAFSKQCEWLILYDGGLYIEKARGGEFHLVIENHSWQSSNLTSLEKILFEWSINS